MNSSDLKQQMMRQVANKINEVSRGITKRRVLPANVIDLAIERANRRILKSRKDRA